MTPIVLFKYPFAAYLLLAIGVFAIVSLVALLAAEIAAWFLIPITIRRVIWNIVDVLLAAAFVAATLLLPLEPAGSQDLTLPTIRVAISAIFGARLLARALPSVLNLVERIGFHSLVAARHLRAKKSGFLAVIGTLAVGAVAVSSCSLTVTLSVMGGFRYELRRKILGSTAHVVVDKKEGTIDGWGPILESTTGAPGVVGANPYVRGEVMITSASNVAGAVLRGIDPTAIKSVTDLERNLTSGQLEYLSAPERLLHLSPKELGILSFDEVARLTGIDEDEILPDRPDAAATDAGARSALSREIDELLAPRPGEAPRTPTSRPPDSTPLVPARDVLPGIILGDELKKVLRVRLGDEITLISPLGDLGPAGPMPKTRRFRVAGAFHTGMFEYDNGLVYVALQAGQSFLNTGDAIHGIEIKVDDMDRAPAIAREIRARVQDRGLRVQDWQKLNQTLFGALALEKLTMFVALGIAILVAAFCVFGTLSLMVQEKSREVAMLKALGATDGSIVRIFLLEGLQIGAFGTLLGTGLGYLVCFVAENFGGVTLREVYYWDKLPIHPDPVEFFLVAVTATFACLLATAFPAILAARPHPVEGLRYQ